MNSCMSNDATNVDTQFRMKIVLAAISAVLIVGCETTTHGQQGEVLGGVIGGVVGAQIGEGRGQTAAIIIGTIAGAMIGRHIGETMGDSDRMMTAQTFNNARTGESASWINPDTGYEYTVTPTRTFEVSDGPCREFRLNATIGDRPDENIYGTACLQADGSWLVQ